MKRLFLCALCLMMLSAARAETDVSALQIQLDTEALNAFLESESEISFDERLNCLLSGQVPEPREYLRDVQDAARTAIAETWNSAAMLLEIALICRLVRLMTGEQRRQSGAAAELIGEITAACILTAVTNGLIEQVLAVCGRIEVFTRLAAPMLATTVTLSGAPATAGAMTPMAAIADELALVVTTRAGIPLVKSAAMLAACATLSRHFRMERLFRLLIGMGKWLLGAVMTGFLATITIRNSILGSYDGATVQATKFAVDHLLPIIGSEVADTVGGVLAGTRLLKNSAGIAVCLSIMGMLLAPAVRLIAVILMMKLLSAGLELIAENSLSRMADRFSTVLELLLAILAASASIGMLLAGAVLFTVRMSG